MSEHTTPETTYRARLAERRSAVAGLLRREAPLAWARLAIFLVGAAMIWPVVFERTWHWTTMLAPLAVFLATLTMHDRIIRRRVRAQRAVAFYESGLERLAHRWRGRGSAGEAFVDPAHPYSGDLDLFGAGSLFELICAARTRSGERTLADWLRGPASPDELRRRQAAIGELTANLDLREDLAVLGDDYRVGVDPERLLRWSAAPPVLTSTWPVWIAAALALGNVAGLLAYAAWRPEPLLISGLLSGVFVGLLYPRVHAVLGLADRPERELVLLSGVLARLETESFASPKLVQLHARLSTAGEPPSRQIARLARLVETNDSRRNMIFAPIAGLLLLGTQLAFALERWRRRSGPAVARWVETVGEMEALSSLAGFAYERPGDPFPEIVDAGPVLEGEALGHPLLPDSSVVRNDVSFAGGLQLFLISGSNMSGKSTLMRTLGVNTVLALAGAPVRARRMRVSPLHIGACMRVQDSLQEGLSHFYAEIKRLRQVMDLTEGELPVLFLLDEILHGTNSHDRSLGAAALVHSLLDRGAIGLVTTHDLALAAIAEQLGTRARNVHFQDHLEGDKMVFDYTLRPGVVQKSNALDLMRAIGLDV